MNLLHTIGLMTRAEHEAAIREAFKAGWRTNAVGEETHPAEYLDGCEQVDFEEYRRLGIALYIGSLVADDGGAEPTDWEAKFKKAVADLEKQAGEIADYRQALARAENMMDQASERLAEIREERDSLRPDAEAHRRKREHDAKVKRDKRAAAKDGAAKPVAKFTKPIPEPKAVAKARAR